jgi:two-component system response regulator BaeR
MHHTPHILVVEDHQEIADVVIFELEDAGYTVEHAIDGKAGLKAFDAHPPDLVILDLNLPLLSGYALFDELRKRSHDIPIIMVTALTDKLERVRGLNMGADDYICKPFDNDELVARVNTVIRRCSRSNDPGSPIKHGPYAIDLRANTLTCFNQRVDLTVQELRVLTLFVKHPSRVFSRDDIIDHLYSDSHPVTDRSVDSCVKRLRRKLRPYIHKDSDPIRTVYGMGYQLAPVKEPMP